ncbi:hypothetical protein K440DRAFT_649093 [Wilcoxina mikolae CBS 423.85]|nr:hypothetical protein K440DRAFT_649093 [Wilcoxina mikolae CBS 423.85]
MLRNIVGDQYHPRSRPPGNPESPRSQEGGENHREGHTGGGEDPHSNHPPFGARLNPRNADSSQAGDTQVPDIHTFLASLFGPPAGDDQLPPALARLFGVPPGAGGDYVYSQAELDRIVSQLMEQHQGNAPPPAAKEDIEALPKVRVTEQMVNEGIDCAVCKEDLMLDEQVTTLPCHHSYHFDCVSKWLEAHDTCPICRHPITPEERRRQPPAQPASPTTSSGIPLAGLPFVGLFGPGGSRWAPMSSGPPRDANQPPNDTGTGTEQPGSTEQGGSGANNNTTGSNQAPNSGSGAAGRSTFASLFRRRGS